MKEFEDFFDRQASSCLKSRNNRKDNVSIHVCQQLFFSQEGQIKSQREFIFFLRKELENKQRVIDNLFKILTVCLLRNHQCVTSVISPHRARNLTFLRNNNQ